MVYDIKYFECVTSTNDIVKELANGGAAEGTVVIAGSQSKGRGRLGRSFMSPGGSGLYMSILLRPKYRADTALLITTAAAAAVAAVLEKHSKKRAYIKWVNDIFIDKKKVCGILCEGQLSSEGKMEYAVLGIGVNLREPEGGFLELSGIAGALFKKEETYDKDAIIKDILNAFFAYYGRLGDKPHRKEYVSRDMLLGKEVTAFSADKELYSARAEGIAEDFSLILNRDGKIEQLSTGEVSVKML